MSEIGAYEAKTHFTRVLDDVERGETVVVTRHGKPVARIVPFEDERREEIAQAIAAIKALRARLPKVPLDELLAMRHEGHKY